MNVKSFFIGSVFVLFLAACGFFYYVWHMTDSPLYRWWVEEMEMGGGPKDFLIEKSGTETIVINKREKFQAKVPDTWTAAKAEQFSYRDWGVNLFSPDVKIKAYSVPYDFVLNDGCVIGIFMEKGNLKYDVATDQISEGLLMEKQELPCMEDDGIEMIKIGNHWAIETLFHDSEEYGFHSRIVVPIDDERYIYIVFYAVLDDKKICFDIFEQFLGNISENN